MARMISCVLVLFAAFSITACRTSSQHPRADDSPTPMQHWIEDERLRAAMKEINNASWPERVPQDPEISARSSELAAAFRECEQWARLLGESARCIPDTVDTTDMTRADRSAFENCARTLQSQATRLERSARAHRIESMQQSLDAIRATCISCHTKFRDFSGELAPPRA